MSTQRNLYREDFYSWCFAQSEALKNKNIEQLDFENLFEEMNLMAARERRELKNRLTILFSHLLKLKIQPEYPNKKSWIRTIKEQRNQIKDICNEDCPSLKNYVFEIAKIAYERAEECAEEETGIERSRWSFTSVISLEEALTDNWLPE